MKENIKIQKTKKGLGILIIVYGLIILNYHCFYLFDYSNIFQGLFVTYLEPFTGIIAVVVSMFCLKSYSATLKPYVKWVRKYFYIVLIIFALIFVYSALVYTQQSIVHTFRIGSRFLYPFLAVPVLLIFIRDKGTERFLCFLNIITFIWYLIIILQKIVYANSGVMLFNLYTAFSTENIAYRDEGIRLTLQAFGNIMLLYNFTKIYCGKVKGKAWVFSLLQTVLGFFCVLFIQQTRMFILTDFICIGIIVLCSGRSVKKQLIKMVTIISVGFYLYFTPVLSNFIGSFFSNEFQFSASSMARDYAIEYYISKFFANPIFGIGWAFEGNYFSLVHGSAGYAYTSDVGFIGLMVELGIFSIIYYLWPICRMIKIMFRQKVKLVVKNNPFELVLFIYIVLTSLTLIVTDGGRILAFPILLALFEYWSVDKKYADVVYSPVQ